MLKPRIQANTKSYDYPNKNDALITQHTGNNAIAHELKNYY